MTKEQDKRDGLFATTPTGMAGMNDEQVAFGTGAKRAKAETKARVELISPFALLRLGHWYRLGAEKYAPRNWEAGMEFARTTASMFRHLIAWMAGDKSEDHLAAIAWNSFALMHYQEMIKRGRMPKELDDMPNYDAEVESDG